VLVLAGGRGGGGGGGGGQGREPVADPQSLAELAGQRVRGCCLTQKGGFERRDDDVAGNSLVNNDRHVTRCPIASSQDAI
jgi:hypothetical protein